MAFCTCNTQRICCQLANQNKLQMPSLSAGECLCILKFSWKRANQRYQIDDIVKQVSTPNANVQLAVTLITCSIQYFQSDVVCCQTIQIQIELDSRYCISCMSVLHCIVLSLFLYVLQRFVKMRNCITFCNTSKIRQSGQKICLSMTTFHQQPKISADFTSKI